MYIRLSIPNIASCTLHLISTRASFSLLAIFAVREGILKLFWNLLVIVSLLYFFHFAAWRVVVPKLPLKRDTPYLDFSTMESVGQDQSHVTCILDMEILSCALVKTTPDVTSMTKASVLERATRTSCIFF